MTYIHLLVHDISHPVVSRLHQSRSVRFSTFVFMAKKQAKSRPATRTIYYNIRLDSLKFSFHHFLRKFLCKRDSNQIWLVKSLKVLPFSAISESCVVLEFELPG